MSSIHHLIELRNRIIYCFLFFIVSFFIAYIFIEDIFSFLTKPFANSIDFKEDKRLIFTGLTEVFISYIKLSLLSALIISFPYLIYQIWIFVAPGLLKKEKKIIFPFLFLIPVMFIFGFTFLYYFVIPLAWDFFVSFDTFIDKQSLKVELEPKVNEYLSLTLKLAFAFGFAFQLPLIIFLFSILGLTTTNELQKKRKYVIVIIFLVAAIITPPDIISQIALAIPILVLYEFSIVMAKLFEKKKK